jgi:hypothetical protein
MDPSSAQMPMVLAVFATRYYTAQLDVGVWDALVKAHPFQTQTQVSLPVCDFTASDASVITALDYFRQMRTT